jgi:hypothetical protein
MSYSIPTNNHSIPLSTAAAMTSRYRTNKELILNSNYQGKNILANCETFNVAAIAALVNTTGAAAIRIYYGMKEDDQVHAILVAVNAEGEDMIGDNSQLADSDDDDPLVEDGQRCPDLCPPPSPLNTDPI